MIKNYLILIAYFVFTIHGFAQWQNLGAGFDRFGKVIYYDSTNQLLYVGGDFHHADHIIVNGVTKWDGVHWDSLGIGAPYGAPVYAITKFQNKLFASSVFQNFPQTNQNWLSWWNGQFWDTLNQRVNQIVVVFKEYNNELYLGGGFTKIGNLNANQIAKFDGVNFTSFPFPSQGGYLVTAIEFFQGDMYVGGNFYDTLTGIHDLERWDGQSFLPFGGSGLASGVDFVSCLQEYNNELYIGGWFTIAAGDPADYVMKWDGSQFHNVGNGLNGPADRMHVFNGDLYVCGRFSINGSTGTSTIVKLVGNQWTAVCPDFANTGINDFTIINYDLYITGAFSYIDSIQMMSVAKYSGITKVNEIQNEFQIQIFPNPVINQILVCCKTTSIILLKIYSIVGEELFSKSINTNETVVNVNNYSPGIYLISAQAARGVVVKKFVKE